VQRFGISVPRGVEAQWKSDPSQVREMKFFPGFFLRELIAWYVALAVLGSLAALSPWVLGSKADSFAPAPAGIRPEWYFMFMFQTLKLIPSKLWLLDGEVFGILLFGVAGLLWLLLPFFEGAREQRGRKLILGAGIFALAYMSTLTLYGYLAK
jgi:quinol-cytochrome oxidoreductase complex cytochrome b subunit